MKISAAFPKAGAFKHSCLDSTRAALSNTSFEVETDARIEACRLVFGNPSAENFLPEPRAEPSITNDCPPPLSRCKLCDKSGFCHYIVFGMTDNPYFRLHRRRFNTSKSCPAFPYDDAAAERQRSIRKGRLSAKAEGKNRSTV